MAAVTGKYLAAFDAGATWFDQLRPLRPLDEPFFPETAPARRPLIPIEITAPPTEHGRAAPSGHHHGPVPRSPRRAGEPSGNR
ncbi:MAG: hypothetical protein A2Z12_07745 [Actinobacteria bacterium RBG_16_68_21]|nr:MAG: hypothetical protein A2Z12_07745 [Actinobacteria bacterium RBG_16_68_21]